MTKWLSEQVDTPPRYQRAEHERRTAKALYAQIQSKGYEGGYTTVSDFIRVWRQTEGQSANVSAFVPLAFKLGEAFQFDWSEEGLVVGGVYHPARATGCYSTRTPVRSRHSRAWHAVASTTTQRRRSIESIKARGAPSMSAGLDAVLVAVELALETGPPGKVRV